VNYKEVFAHVPQLSEWNELVLPAMKENGRDSEFTKEAVKEAVRRGYLANRVTGLYVERAS
jgi:hypothetical protein